ncbi:succinylglutamate desuccinylase/aspartoacylase family protein [Candidatus Woesearchaeota archaeon]|nr:succinylglutamate desuccinylase/aspartoacylase family protein [Candidatus Woesearchaeota archaeon]
MQQGLTTIKGRPIVGVIGCIHGNEFYGKEVLARLRKLKIRKGTLVTVFANQKAHDRKQRFVKQDLNRSFPGTWEGNHEQRLAAKIMKAIRKSDFVVDLHSSSTSTPPFIILSRITKEHLRFLERIPVERVVYMHKRIASGKALIDHCKCGVSLEMGKHAKANLARDTYEIVREILANLGMTGETKGFKIKPKKLFVVRDITSYSTYSTESGNNAGLMNFVKAKEKGKSFYPLLITPRKYAYDNVHFLKAEEEPYEKLKYLIA